MNDERPRLLLVLPTHTYQADEFMAAAARLDLDLTVGTEFPSSLESFRPADLTTISLDNLDSARQQARRFASEYPLAAVFGVNDRAAVVAAAIAEELGLPHTSLESARLGHDKLAQRRVFRDAGVRVPHFSAHHADETLPRIALPLVIKPTCLSASRGVIKVSDTSELEGTVKRVLAIVADSRPGALKPDSPAYLAEEFIDGPEFALEGLVVKGKLHVLAIFDKPDPLDGPFFQETLYVSPTRYPARVQENLIACAVSATEALGIDRGPVHIEMRHNDAGAWLIELAARPIGGKCGRVLVFQGERSLEEVLLAHAAGLESEIPETVDGATGVMMIPATRRGKLGSIEGLERARDVPGITGLIITAHAGQEIVPLPEGSVYLGFIFARGDDAETVEGSLRTSYGQLEIQISS